MDEHDFEQQALQGEHLPAINDAIAALPQQVFEAVDSLIDGESELVVTVVENGITQELTQAEFSEYLDNLEAETRTRRIKRGVAVTAATGAIILAAVATIRLRRRKN